MTNKLNFEDVSSRVIIEKYPRLKKVVTDWVNRTYSLPFPREKAWEIASDIVIATIAPKRMSVDAENFERICPHSVLLELRNASYYEMKEFDPNKDDGAEQVAHQHKAEQLDTVCRHLRRVAKGDLAQNDGVNHKSLAYEVVESINDILLPDTDEEESMGDVWE